jgi:hypothetical protein
MSLVDVQDRQQDSSRPVKSKPEYCHRIDIGKYVWGWSAQSMQGPKWTLVLIRLQKLELIVKDLTLRANILLQLFKESLRFSFCIIFFGCF